MASPSLLAHITTAKFVDGIPLTRQSKQFERLGLSLNAATMGTWVNTIGAQKLPPMINLMHEAFLAEALVHLDETSVQVLKSEKTGELGSLHGRRLRRPTGSTHRTLQVRAES